MELHTSAHNPTPPQDLSGIVGHRLIYTYANGWQYEMYVKNATTIDYRIHTGNVGGRWVKDQKVEISQLVDDVYKIAWVEPTGTTVSNNIIPSRRLVHGNAFFPRWVEDDPKKTVCFQNDHLDQIQEYRDAGPTYPIWFLTEFGYITLFEFVGVDDESIVSVAPSELPADFLDRTN
ncbi:phenolic acid decarboxylase [Williamsia sp. CHRR-6]|uniref:phenolic acid decarboxylase n=1 Tax=Williamsia sp. CHRR-6 TaxID=2835871 RepID=UPI001BDABC7A|nr:phenolic acid decarboxylase [Williamsia sp. CHRR-6]MBT0566120.1 phenolic acid decarboxylase [Williamsia sp. CHRR-6]